MSVPTFTSVTPTSGLSMGMSAVKIVGTNFRPAPSPPPASFEGPGYQQTMSVTFDGVEADAIMVADDTTIWASTPEYFGSASDLPDAVDIVLTNLDDDGVPIAGETITATDAFTYQRQDLTTNASGNEGAIKWTATRLLDFFQRHVVENTVLTTDPEYSDEPSAGLVALGTLPGIVLVGPIVSDDPIRVDNITNDVPIPGETGISVREIPRRPKILGFAIHCFGRTKGEAMLLSEATDNAVNARGKLRMLDQRGGSDTITLQMRLTDTWEPFDDQTTHGRRVSNALDLQGIRLRGGYGNELGPQASSDQPVTYESGDNALTLEISSS